MFYIFDTILNIFVAIFYIFDAILNIFDAIFYIFTPFYIFLTPF